MPSALVGLDDEPRGVRDAGGLGLIHRVDIFDEAGRAEARAWARTLVHHQE